ncbi:DUF445 domain-containing protein [Radiobacillus sp. PE A8.2]|uniref:DUF445 domain-containing protein n=1 Tax=Radiobacillus sp. PE A8.2 TaxID=3380349 RepID=UPI00388E30C1
MAVIGAAIGGITNSLAIKMLFRPYSAKYIFGRKVPFTPGLIPKRRQELAKQLGKMVVEHLLTPEGLKRKLQHATFQNQLKGWAKEEARGLLEKDITIQQQLEKMGVPINESIIRGKMEDWTEAVYEKYMESRRQLPLKELLDEQLIHKVEQKIDPLSSYAQQKLGGYLESEACRRKLEDIMESFLEGRGFFGNMIASFMDKDSMIDKIQPMIVQYAYSSEVRQWMNQIISNEWQDWLNQPLEHVERKLGGRGAILKNLAGVTEQLPIGKWLNSTMREVTAPVTNYIVNVAIPPVITTISASLADRMDTLLQRLQLEEIVEKEVETFPIERIEQLVLSISAKEFKLITYLGALLGGMIGVVQGLIVLVIQ